MDNSLLPLLLKQSYDNSRLGLFQRRQFDLQIFTAIMFQCPRQWFQPRLILDSYPQYRPQQASCKCSWCQRKSHQSAHSLLHNSLMI
ncbi:hypothetical protein FGO68_gene1938 [Halteria grandinella]|uniref:Uncharacterized protein n=1 Tax=Halteria grandinella TaxID=5974 RepID=A0A8J8NWA6_HALGN|nr:hypothetical protein FGO68_gene1938 [Halteria grandinella]